jgi:HSP20 family protein
MANAKKKAAKKSSPSNGTKRQSSPGREKANQPEGTATSLSRSEPNEIGNSSPLTFMRRFSEEMDRLFGEYGFGRGWLAPSLEGGLDRLTALGNSKFSPQVEVLERDNTLVIRADLPGMTKDNVNIEIANEAVVIRGERKSEREEDAGGYYRSERSYGSFYRRIPLPEGVSIDKAAADFRNGVLEISIPAGQQVAEKRRQLEIRGESEALPRSKARAAGQS